MEIKPLPSVFIILAVLTVIGLVYKIPEQALPEQALPEQPLPEQALGTGALELYLCDAPLDAEDVTGVHITINEIQYHLNNRWITCEEFEGPGTYNLLELRRKFSFTG
jgi:hypothetical protein